MSDSSRLFSLLLERVVDLTFHLFDAHELFARAVDSNFFINGQWPFFSLYPIARKVTMTVSQYKLYERTEPSVAEFCQPRMALNMPHPAPPLT